MAMYVMYVAGLLCYVVITTTRLGEFDSSVELQLGGECYEPRTTSPG